MNPLAMINFILLMSIHLLGINACKTTPPVENKATLPIENKIPLVVEHTLKPIIELPAQLTECSGMIPLGSNKFIAHNDSGNQPYLYVFNTTGKMQTSVIKVTGVKNNDWEELTSDDDFIYIGDTGNNGGTRQNLMIYKIKKEDILSRTEVTPEIISFRYEGQTKFNDSNRHNFDCEAMISKGDSLFLFSKNRGDFRTDVYGIPKVPGEYVTKIMGSFDSEGLITGADYRKDGLNGELVLVGYSIHGKAFYPFILHFPKVEESEFLTGEHQRITFEKVLQTETIAFTGPNKVVITNEEEDGSPGFIYEITLSEY